MLSCLFSWNGEVSYWLNGVDMGVAFRGLNTGVNWYPAASVAMDQTCSFNFGDKPFRFGAKPTNHVHMNTGQEIRKRSKLFYTRNTRISFRKAPSFCRNLYAIFSHVKKAYTANQNGV